MAYNEAAGVNRFILALWQIISRDNYSILALILPKMDKKFSYLQCGSLKYNYEK